jgi:hypothetical protein
VAPLALADREAAFYPIAGYSAYMSARTPAVTGALLIALLVPASAEAAAIQPLKPCYVTAGTAAAPQAEGVAISASGFTPNFKVDLAVTLDGQPAPGSLAGLQTDPAGNLNLPADQLGAPFVAGGTHEFEITLTEQGNLANTASATAKTTALGVRVKPRRARPSQRIRFRGSGFTAPKPVYAHYVYKKKVRKTVRMARKTGTCGGWRARKRQIPVNEPKPGLWTVQFDQSKKYIDGSKEGSTLDSVFVRLGISVTLVPRRD